MRFVELFAGIGGFRYGLESVNREANRGSQEVKTHGGSKRHQKSESPNAKRGQPGKHGNGRLQKQFTSVYANEFNKYAAQIYERHYEKPDTRDIREVKISDIPEHDLHICL